MEVLFLWTRCSDYIQKYQSGAQQVEYFNSKLAEVQSELFNDFSPLYGKNELVKLILDFWVREQTGTSASDGTVTAGTGDEVVNRPLSIGYTTSGNIVFQIPSVEESELVASYRIPQRAPNVSKKIVYYRFNTPNSVKFYPSVAVPFKMFYLIYPTEAHIAFTYTETDDEDVMTYDAANSEDLAWPAAADNLIIYKMLEKIGVSIREQLLQEYSKFGFTQDLAIGGNAQ